MTDYERRHRSADLVAGEKAIVRVQFSPSQSLAAALKKFSRSDNKPMRLYSSRMAPLRFEGHGYAPDDRRWLSRSEDRMKPAANHQQRLASYVLLRDNLGNGGIGVDLKLMPSPNDIEMFGEFALDSDAQPTNYMDVHAIIPAQDRVPAGVALNLATHGLHKLLRVDDEELHPDGGPLAVPYRGLVFAHDAKLVSRNPTGRHLH